MEQLRHIMVRVLRRAEDFGFLLCFFALLLVETGYVAWLERLPTFPAPEQPAPLSLCLSSTDGQGLSNALTDGAWGHDRVERVEPSGLFPKQAPRRRNRRRSPNCCHRPPEGGGFLGSVGRCGSAGNSTGG